MGETTQTGGWAFPTQFQDKDGTFICEPGMTLRDWFAGMTLQALVSIEITEDEAREVAELAYLTADAMLKERCAPLQPTAAGRTE